MAIKLFVRGSETGLRFTLLCVLSISLMVLDHYYHRLYDVKAVLSFVVSPIHYMVHAPMAFYDQVLVDFSSRVQLLDDNTALKTELLLLKVRVQRLSALEKENQRLKALLKSSAKAGEHVLVAKLLQVDPDPFSHLVILDKGSFHGVYEGQPVLDAYGVMGQIVTVGLYTSTALLITDLSHAIPVQSNRSGARTIAVGTGVLDQLELSHVTNTTDLKQGDLLVTSGLANRFPSGYPVGTITSIEHDPGQAFSRVNVRPSAHLDRSREVLLVWHHDKTPNWVDNHSHEQSPIAEEETS